MREGAPVEMIEEAIAQRRPPLFLDEMEHTAIRLFAKVQSQWQRSPANGVPIGLNYQGVETVARIAVIELDERLFQCIQIMEVECIKLWHEKAATAAASK